MNMILSISAIVLIVYVIIVAIFIIMENRSPQSTFAWLFLFITFPVIGLIIYFFFGRGWRAFSQEKEIARQELGSEFMQDLGSLLNRQQEIIERTAREKPASFKKKLLRLVEENSSSVLTGANQIEILQDATMKYPRLLEDIKAAQHSAQRWTVNNSICG